MNIETELELELTVRRGHIHPLLLLIVVLPESPPVVLSVRLSPLGPKPSGTAPRRRAPGSARAKGQKTIPVTVASAGASTLSEGVFQFLALRHAGKQG